MNNNQEKITHSPSNEDSTESEIRYDLSSNNDSLELSKEDIFDSMKQILSDKYKTELPDEAFLPVSFGEFYGYRLPVQGENPYKQPAENFAHVLTLLEQKKETNFLEYDDYNPGDYQIMKDVSDTIKAEDDLETMALVSVLKQDEELCTPQGVDIVADIYASFDDIKRLIGVCRIMDHIDENSEEVLTEYWEKRKRMYSANRDRISFDKSKDIEKELLRLEACYLEGTWAANEKALLSLAQKMQRNSSEK